MFIPKQGEIIEVSDDEKKGIEREFIAMTKNNRYLCWQPTKNSVMIWNNARPIWKRADTVEMTVEEICKALGKNVKIVK